MRRSVLSGLLVALVALSGCGGSSPVTPVEPPAPPAEDGMPTGPGWDRDFPAAYILNPSQPPAISLEARPAAIDYRPGQGGTRQLAVEWNCTNAVKLVSASFEVKREMGSIWAGVAVIDVYWGGDQLPDPITYTMRVRGPGGQEAEASATVRWLP